MTMFAIYYNVYIAEADWLGGWKKLFLEMKNQVI